MSDLVDKLSKNEAGILLYGMTPPKQTHSNEKIDEIAQKTIKRIKNLPIDGIVLYDLQDESDRAGERTFEFIQTLCPRDYYRKYFKDYTDAVIYKAVGKYSSDELRQFLHGMHSNESVVFVGASSRNSIVKTKLAESYGVYNESRTKALLGGICIPERHTKSGEEHLKVAGKISAGCGFFITQAVYDLGVAKKFIDDYSTLNCKRVPIIFTFTPCGSSKTLEFMQWLGINVPDFLRTRLLDSDDMLLSSRELCLEMFKFLYIYGKLKGVNVGANVESVSTRRIEIEAAIDLLKDMSEFLKGRK